MPNQATDQMFWEKHNVLGGFGQLFKEAMQSNIALFWAGVAVERSWVCLLFDVAQSTGLSVDHNSSERCWGTPVNYVEAADRVS